MKKLIILGDSLSMPRPDFEYEKTYLCLLKKILFDWDIIIKNRRSNDTEKTSRHLFKEIAFLKPDMVVIHLGIVDCAPRLFSKSEKKVVNKMPLFLQKRIIDFLSKYRYFFTKYFKKTYVPDFKFEKCMTYIIKTIFDLGAVPIVINIAGTNSKNKLRSCGFEKNINRYNQILNNILKDFEINTIDINSKGTDVLLSDGIHLNEVGHQWVAEQIGKQITKKSMNNALMCPDCEKILDENELGAWWCNCK